MTQDQVAVVSRMYEALNRRDWDAAFRDADPDFEITLQRGPFAGSHPGCEGVRSFIEEYAAAFR